MAETHHGESMAEVHYPDDRVEHPAVRHERSDASFGWILGIVIVSIVAAVIIQVVLWGMFRYQQEYQAKIKRPSFPLAVEQQQRGGEPLPPEPRLEPIDRMQGSQPPDVSATQAAKEAVLDSYGLAEEKGFVRMPVDRAMKLTLGDNQLKARTGPAAGTKRAEGLLDWGESSSGRMFRVKP